MTVIGSRKTWRNDDSRTRHLRGPLVVVTISPGKMVKMYEADAIEAGLLPGKAKKAPEPGNKMGPVPANKAPAPAPEPETAPEPDDFTTIEGVGKASARSLVAQGITTFAQLKAADLDRLSVVASVRRALEEWRG